MIRRIYGSIGKGLGMVVLHQMVFLFILCLSVWSVDRERQMRENQQQATYPKNMISLWIINTDLIYWLSGDNVNFSDEPSATFSNVMIYCKNDVHVKPRSLKKLVNNVKTRFFAFTTAQKLIYYLKLSFNRCYQHYKCFVRVNKLNEVIYA